MLKAVSVLKQFNKIGLNCANEVPNLLPVTGLSLIKVPNRTTFILKRKTPHRLLKSYIDHSKWRPSKKHDRVYEVVKFTEMIPESNIDVILTSYVQGLGDVGDLVNAKRSYAYNQLLLPGLAEYATPEAIEKANKRQKNVEEKDDQQRYSSLHVHRTMNVLSSLIISVTMNKENKWVLEPWHIKVAFRKAGVHLSEDCIELPKNKIEGPDMNLERKEFLVTVTINNKEKVQVRCRLHHWSTEIIHRLQPESLHWTKPAEPMFIEESELLSKMPLPPVPKTQSSSRI